MRKESKNTYTREFKKNAVYLVKTSDKSMSQIARNLGIACSSLHRWCEDFSQEGDIALYREDSVPNRDEVRRLKLELELLRQERDILKKTVSIFSREAQ